MKRMVNAHDKREKKPEKLLLGQREIRVAVGKIVTDIGNMPVSVIFFINKVRVGDNGKEWESPVGDVKPVDIPKDRFFCFQN